MIKNKFTNVKREDDFVTKWMRKHWTNNVNQNHKNSDIGTVIFNCALFRYFGTIEFGERLVWCSDADSDSNSDSDSNGFDSNKVLEAAIILRKEGYHVFTKAYCKPHHNAEGSALGSIKCYLKVCSYLTSLWAVRSQLTQIAETTRSWRSLVLFLRDKKSKVVGFGGSGFMAKEIILDALHTAALTDKFDDLDQWCPCGPGARRGLNRLFERPIALCVTESRVEEGFISEMRHLLAFGRTNLPTFCATKNLELHDIQFQLCEYDKYCRCLNGEGSVTSYTPRSDKAHSPTSPPPLPSLSQSEIDMARTLCSTTQPSIDMSSCIENVDVIEENINNSNGVDVEASGYYVP